MQLGKLPVQRAEKYFLPFQYCTYNLGVLGYRHFLDMFKDPGGGGKGLELTLEEVIPIALHSEGWQKKA